MKRTIGLGLVLLFFSAQLHAIDVGVGVNAGINGIGVDLSVGLTKTVNLRISASSLEIDDEDETIEVGDAGGEADLDAELEFDYGANAVLIDWHIFDSEFRVTAGMMRNTGEVDLTATLTNDVVLDGGNLSPTDISGDITGEVALADSYQPYIGVGWGRGAGGDGGFSFSFDVGVALLDIEADLDATVDPGGSNGLSQAELDDLLRQMESDAEDDLDDYELWPVVAFGVNYAF